MYNHNRKVQLHIKSRLYYCKIHLLSVNYKDVCQNWIACITIDAMPRKADLFLAQHSSKSGFQLQ